MRSSATIPVSALGLLAYIAILILSFIRSDAERQWPAMLIFGLALIGVMFQLLPELHRTVRAARDLLLVREFTDHHLW